jgi:hypothetical protein
VHQANTIITPATQFTGKTYKDQITSDTDIVKIAGALASAMETDGWDPGIYLVAVMATAEWLRTCATMGLAAR